jgi:hypothetical protein
MEIYRDARAIYVGPKFSRMRRIAVGKRIFLSRPPTCGQTNAKPIHALLSYSFTGAS